ncbi:hypothetical protein CBM2592_A80067 [Cupriavidus taiwanensis]|nr:hypothetical protein CBM2588_A50063 [Cupriavidus taiwanensis]SOY55722.1 hypothetical protein CBM2592_A80067 [Cupriavidus taiwanensis]SOY90555.1 hypothetical protein CBM2591_A80066 [Cupriavidus taiwanensis]SOZ63066.1 hypothetical protein CBM2617_A50007 [Cupriavidus taiwanensis]SOZ82280.1 hypothetical protein CBM2618_A60007 [Cupriavidus taiwanensis]
MVVLIFYAFPAAQRDPNVLDVSMLDLLEANNMPQTTKYL